MAALFLIFLLSCKGKTKETGAPQKSKEPTEIGKPGYAPLSEQSIDSFIAWASASGEADRERVRNEISKGAGNPAISDALFKRYDAVTITDLSYSLVVLSILGELKQPQNLGRFEKIIWQPVPLRKNDFNEGLDSTDAIEMLASKATECVAWLKTPGSDSALLRIIRDHNSKPVRSAAIDAFLYSRNDSEEARKYLQRFVRKEDIPLLYRVRYTSDQKDNSFNNGMEAFYKQFPGEVATVPGEPTEKPKADTSKPEQLTEPPVIKLQ